MTDIHYVSCADAWMITGGVEQELGGEASQESGFRFGNPQQVD